LSAMVAIGTLFHWQPGCSQVCNWYNNNCVANWSPPYYYFPFYFNLWSSDNYCPVPMSGFKKMTIVVRVGPVVDDPVLKCAETVSAGDVILFWIPPPDTGTNFMAYVIYRDTSQSGPFQPIDTIYNINQISYTDYGINPNFNVLYYKIKTFSGYSGWISTPTCSNIVSTIKLNVNISYGNPPGLNWSASGVLPANPWYYIYASCNGQPWALLDSTQQTNYLLDNGDTWGCQFLVLLNDQAGCSNASTISYYGIGEKDISNRNCFDIFPNPAYDKLDVRFNVSAENKVIELYDIYGRRHVMTFLDNKTASEITMDVSSLSPGIYYLRNPECTGAEKVLILR
jgi:hypothetical protein